MARTTYNFRSRLSSHKKDWLDTYRGEKFVRLGRIVSPKRISNEERKELINDVEKSLIFYISNIDKHELIANVVSTKSSNFNNILKIKNIGYRGHLPEELYISEDMLVDS